MCIPQDAAHKDNAHKFLEYILQPEVIAKCTNLTNYANANAKAAKFVNPDVLSNPAVYPDEKVMQRLYTLKPLTEEEDRALTQAMTEIKSG
jgi:putrescine transport system substrate-binding protein